MFVEAIAIITCMITKAWQLKGDISCLPIIMTSVISQYRDQALRSNILGGGQVYYKNTARPMDGWGDTSMSL